MKLFFQILLITGILFARQLCSQDFNGTVKYLVTHNWVKKILAVDYLSKSKKEEYEYVWSSRAEYKEYSLLTINNYACRYEETGETPGYGTQGMSWRADEYIIYRDIKNKQSYDLVRLLDKLYVVQDSTYFQNWKILNDMREIAGHICMNASWKDTVKNNEIIAWFALDIPVSVGPDRFGGLPGLILEIDVNQGALVISAEKITTSDENVEILKPAHRKKIKKLKEAEFRAIIAKHVEDSKKREEPYFYGLRY